MLIPESVTFALPVSVMVIFCVTTLPVFTLPKLRLEALNDIVAVAATPAPVNAKEVGEVGALLTIETAPAALPLDCGENWILKVVVAPGFKEIGRLTELLVNPLPLTLNCVIVNTPVPLLPICIVCEFGVPTLTLPKPTLDGFVVIPACTPLPVSGTTALVPCELMKLTLPVTVSAVFGPNVKFTDAFLPGAKVNGVVTPLAVTSFAATLMLEIVMFELPLFVTVTLFELVPPALTVPKLRLVGLAEIVADAATPVPSKLTAFGEFGALLDTETLPLRLPPVVGANNTLNVAVFPAAIVAGALNPLTL
jgi:hypothetical protein